MSGSTPAGSCSASLQRWELRHHTAILMLALAVLVAAACLRRTDHDTVALPWAKVDLPDVCMLHRVTAIPCPGCGLTRGTLAMMQGDWSDAVDYNLASPIMFLLIVGQIPYRGQAIWRCRQGRPPWTIPGGHAWWAIAFVPMVGQWIARLLGRL